MSLTVNGLLVRFAPPEDYGNYAAAFSAVLLISYVARLGTDRLAIREIRDTAESSPADVNQVSADFLGLAIVLATMSGLLAIGVSTVVSEFAAVDRTARMLLVLWVAIETSRPIVMEILRSHLRLASAASVGQGGRTICLFVGVVIAVSVSSLDANTLIFIGFAASTLPTAFGLVALRSVGRETSIGVRRGVRLLVDGRSTLWFYSIAGFAAMAIGTGDLLVVRSIGSASAAAPYAIALALSGAIGLVMTIVNTAVSPALQALARGQDQRHATALLRSLSTLSTLPGIALLFVSTAIAYFAVPRLGGDDYGQAYVIVLTLGVGQLAGVFAGPCGTLLLLTGYERLVAIIAGTCAVVALVAEVVVLCLTESLFGVAAISAAAVGAHHALLGRAARQHLGLTTWGFWSVGSTREAIGLVRNGESTLIA